MMALITFPFGILLLLLSWIQFGHGFMGNVGKLADVMPNDPTVEVGDTLVLNCTLMPLYNGTQNASNIYFDHNLKNYTYPYVQTLSNITAQLRLPNITSDMHGSYLCRLPGVYLGLGAAQSLYVVRRPLKPVLDGCIISNWEKMECSWSPSRAKQDNHTSGMKTFVQTLFYRHPGDDENWKTCPQNASDKCTWPATQFKMGANYCIQINATNILKHIVTSDVTCVVAQDEIVKPNPPEHVESSFASEFDGHVTLRWDPPTSSYQYEMPLIYQVDVQNQWHNQISNVTTETSMKLPVVPATNYVVQISVRPSRGGFASDKVVKTFVTPATAPCKNPDTQMNAFFLAKESGTVRLYWQPITARDSCGPDLSYEVRARQSDGETNGAGSWRTMSSVASFGNSAEVMLSEGEDEVTIQSKNNIGFASDLPHIIIRVPSSSKGNSSSNNMYRLVVEGNDNSVMAHWFDTAQPQVENVMGYTLFWCQRWSFNHICKTPIQWKNLNGTESEYNLILSDNYLHFQIGLAVNLLLGSTSGIMWADKLYSQTAKAEAPRIVEVVTPYLGYHGEIDISWTTTPCTVPCAYVQTFVISYCLADHQNKCHGETQNISIESWKNFTYNLANLEHGSTYKIWMTSVARTGSSEPSAPIYATTTKSWVTAGAVAGIIIAILCVGTIAIGGLYIILRNCNKCRKKFVDGLNLPVALPPTHRLPIPSTSSEAPMLGKNFEYNRQESVSSGDSGRYSLSPASPATSPLLPKLIDVNENLDSFMPGNFSTLEDVKVDDDNDSTRGCVLSYTLVSNDAPEGESVVPNGFRKSVTTLPNGAAKMGDVRNPGVVSNGDNTGHSKYIFPEQIELLGMFSSNPESDVNYCTSFSFARPSTGNNTSGNSVADIGYTKVENLQPLYDLVDRLPNADADNYQSQDFNGLQSESSQDAESVEQSDLVCTIDQLLATLNADPPLTNDLQIDNPATSSENSEPELSLPPPPPPRPGENDALFRGYMKIANTDFPSLARDDVEWGAEKPDFPQQPSLTNWGYVDHAMFGVDSIA